jgi:hypothetical protein
VGKRQLKHMVLFNFGTTFLHFFLRTCRYVSYFLTAASLPIQ